jgi:hypothetical protein
MSVDPLEPVDPSLAALFGDERARGTAPPGTKERVLGRLLVSIGPPPGGGSGGSGGQSGGGVAAASAGMGKGLPILGAFLIGGAVGGTIVAVAKPAHVVYVDRVVEASIAAPVPPPPRAPSEDTRPVLPSPSVVEPEAPLANPSSSAPSRDVALAAERAILDIARTALGRGDGVHALEATNRHAREFPRGQMTEEREAIAVQALAKLGRKEEAAARGARFKERYPGSVLTPVIDAALEMTRTPANGAKE